MTVCYAGEGYQNGYLKYAHPSVSTQLQLQHPTQMDGKVQSLCDSMNDACHSNFTVLTDLCGQQRLRRAGTSRRGIAGLAW